MQLAALLLVLACSSGSSDGRPDTGSGDGGDTDGGTTTAAPVLIDVLVIGSGPAGMSAAWEAHQAGAGVIVLERDAVAGGAGSHARHLIAAGTRWQADAALVDSPEQLLAEWTDLSGGGDPTDPWVQALAWQSAELLEWLVDDLGATVLTVFADHGGGATPRMHIVEAPGGGGPVQVLLDDVGDLVWTEVEAGALRRDDSGAVTGATATDQVTGERYEIEAAATIVATGGFGRDLDLVLDTRPELAGATVVFEAHPSSDGGGRSLLAGVSAADQNLQHHGVYVHSAADPRVGLDGEAIILDSIAASMIVDSAGRRVANENETFGFALIDTLTAAPDKRLWSIMPAPVFDESQPMSMGTALGLGATNEDLDSVALEELGVAIRAASATAVGDLTDIDPDGLQDSLDRYRELLMLGEDLDFGKDPADLVPFEGGDLIVIELVAGSAKSFGGAWLDEEARVLDTDGAVIPGLFAAGEVAGMLGTPDVSRGFSGSVTACYLTGRVAGRAAATRALED